MIHDINMNLLKWQKLFELGNILINCFMFGRIVSTMYINVCLLS